MQKEADTAPDPDLEIRGGPGHPADLGISISFKCDSNVIIQIQYTKNLNPGRFELKSSITIPILE